jgi:hypothetical protein
MSHVFLNSQFEQLLKQQIFSSGFFIFILIKKKNGNILTKESKNEFFMTHIIKAKQIWGHQPYKITLYGKVYRPP